jgi:hypothetical protein
MLKKVFSFLLPAIVLCFQYATAQQSLSTTLSLSETDSVYGYVQPPSKHLDGRLIAIPVTFIAYGAASLKLGDLKKLNTHMNNEIFLESRHKPLHFDNYLQYAPAAIVYGLNLAGVKGKNNFIDRTMIYGISNAILGATVMTTKHFTHEWRPDGSNQMSFPSGHTATAFAAAEFMRREYQDKSVWYGVAGYAMAATTGYMRMYNNRHWFGDVVAGAGVGILSTDLAYFLYPKMKRIFTGTKDNGATVVTPTYQDGAVGLSLVHMFK